MNEYNYTNLTPFKWFILENFPFIEESIDAITNYQLFCKLGEEINKIIDNVNLSGEQVENLTNAFIQLQNYVNNYFDNLDVQDEIDNKLDSMAQDGTLTTLISDYMQPFIDNQNDEINNFKNEINRRINIQDNMINSVTNGSPLIASNVTEMTDTTKIYVNTTDGKWYYYNGNDWVIGGTYQGTMLDTVNQNKLNETYSEVINIYQTPILNGFINASGILQQIDNSYHTDFIDINKYTNILYQTFLTSGGNEISYYDENKNYLSGIRGDSSRLVKNITPLSNARYLIMSYFAHTDNRFSPFIYLYKENSLVEKVEKINDNLNDYVINEKIIPNQNGFINSNGILQQIDNSYHTKLIKVNQNDIIEYQTFLIQTGNEISYYDENQNYLSGIRGDSNYNIKNIIPPNNAKYVIMSYYSNDNIPNPYIRIYNKDSFNYLLKHFNQPTGNINCLGDSITLGLTNNNISYANLLINMGYNVTKYGVSGSSIALQENKTDSFLERYSSMTNDADLVLIMGGTNDFGVEIPIGDFNVRDNYTFYGALRSLIEGLINKYPTKKIFFVTELDRNYTLNGINFKDYIDAIFICCRYYAIPILDLNLMLGYNSKNQSQRNEYIPDGLHPNTKGHQIIADKIDKFIRYTL